MLYNFQIFRINLNWMTLADIALLHNRFNLSITRLAISYIYIKHNIVMLTEKYIAFARHVVVLNETRNFGVDVCVSLKKGFLYSCTAYPNSQIFGHQKICCDLALFKQKELNLCAFHQNMSNKTAISEDPDQPGPMHSLIWVCTVCPDLSV